MIYTDGVHVITDGDEQELHNFAALIGLKPCWYHGRRKGHPHYDVTSKKMRFLVLVWGAELVSPKELVAIMRTRERPA